MALFRRVTSDTKGLSYTKQSQSIHAFCTTLGSVIPVASLGTSENLQFLLPTETTIFMSLFYLGLWVTLALCKTSYSDFEKVSCKTWIEFSGYQYPPSRALDRSPNSRNLAGNVCVQAQCQLNMQVSCRRDDQPVIFSWLYYLSISCCSWPFQDFVLS